MKWMLPIIGVLLSGCAKHEVDIDAMYTNPFDPDWSGPSFIAVDSSAAIPVIPGAVYKQRVYLRVSPALSAGGIFSIRAIETTIPDTIYSSSSASLHWFDNQQVQIGSEYCYIIDVLVDGEPLTNHRIASCQLVEL